MRELRLCFEDPEWEQLTIQILTKVTEVTAPSGVVLLEGGRIAGTLSRGLVWGCPGRHWSHGKCSSDSAWPPSP